MPESTVRYLSIEVDDALAIVEQVKRSNPRLLRVYPSGYFLECRRTGDEGAPPSCGHEDANDLGRFVPIKLQARPQMNAE